jgi:hypothetical protein
MGLETVDPEDFLLPSLENLSAPSSTGSSEKSLGSKFVVFLSIFVIEYFSTTRRCIVEICHQLDILEMTNPIVNLLPSIHFFFAQSCCNICQNDCEW